MGPFEADFLHSLWEQAAHLHDHLEWDLLANHIFRDLAGLAWAGRFFHEQRAGQWLATATRFAGVQADEQALPDGGHFERSPRYHMEVMEDLRCLALLIEEEATRARLRAAWRRMAEYLRWLRHPGGLVPLFNDAANEAEGESARALRAGENLGTAVDAELPRGGRHFKDAGMVAWHGDPWTVFFDVGPVGPDYQPGHAHADTLALEASYLDRRLLVDPGTHSYDRDERRRYDRSTAAHNTVCIDNQDSSEVWHIFRTGRRALPLDVRASFSENGMDAAAAHNGYDHLPGRPRHSRQVIVRNGAALRVQDRVEGKDRHGMECGYLLAPEWTATPVNGGWNLTSGPHVLRLTVRGPSGLQRLQERVAYHPEYGKEVASSRVGWRLGVALPVEVIVLIETQRSGMD